MTLLIRQYQYGFSPMLCCKLKQNDVPPDMRELWEIF